MEHIVSIEEMIHSRKVERKEAGETSRGHDQPVIVSSSEEENFMKLKEARVKGMNRWTKKPKIQKDLLLRGHKDFQKYCQPRVISIGPIHHGNPRYRLAEEYKLTLAANFIDESGKTDKELYMVIKNNIEQLRRCFDKEVIHNYNDDALSWMLFVDGCTTLKFIDSVVDGNVRRFQITMVQVASVQQDLFLLENQLPYQILDDLIKNSNKGEKLKKSVQSFINVHSMTLKTLEKPANKEPAHLLDLLRNRLLGCTSVSHKNNSYQEDWRRSFGNVQKLKAVGIHLMANEASCLLNITFTKKWKFYGGILRLPPITVDDLTGIKFFNLIAYEMDPEFKNDYAVTSYVFFLDSLIKEAKDVMHLRQAGILRNFLGSDDEVAQVFNEIATDLVPNPEIYKDVRVELQRYYHDNKFKIWISQTVFYQAYSGVLLGLTLSLVQMIYTILSYEYQRRH
ncbi:hypothetical protein SO802_032044 [Lithocarpus litseifolius]|uniref:Uncharacterized protein n=1 Tax=Lithocarpus litseifolius TaxID=425828 RepID=A0AAW2BP10_9ROSI